MRYSLISLVALVGTHLFVGASPANLVGRDDKALAAGAPAADVAGGMDMPSPDDGTGVADDGTGAVPDADAADPTQALSGLTDVLNGLLSQVGNLLNGLLGGLLSGGSTGGGGGDLLGSLGGIASGLGGAADSIPTSTGDGSDDAGVGDLGSQLAAQLGNLGSQMSGLGGAAPAGASPADIASALQAIIDAASGLFEILAPASGDMADDVSGAWDDASGQLQDAAKMFAASDIIN